MKPLRNLSSVLAITLAGCGGGDSDPPPVVDQPDAPPVVEKSKISVETFGDSPVFIRFRDGNGEWQEPTDTGESFDFEVVDAFEVLAVCGDDTNGFDVGIAASTVAEAGGSIFLPCFTPFDPGTRPTTVEVTGTMKQAGSVSVGFASATSGDPNWDFALDVAVGPADLIAVGNGRIELQRDLDIQRATALPAIDVAADGAALVDLEMTVGGTQATDDVGSTYFLGTQNSFFQTDRLAGTTLPIAPPELVTGNDFQFLMVDANGTGTFRDAFVLYSGGDAPAFDLLPPLVGVTVDGAAASWSTLPAGDVEIDAFSGGTSWHKNATPGWLGTQTAMALDDSLPPLRPEWKLGTIQASMLSVQATTTDGVSLRSGVVASPTAKRRTGGTRLAGWRTAHARVLRARAK